MDLEQLRRFIAVAESLNFRQAARTLRISQPQLSRSIQQLEGALQTTLLERGRRGATLTPAGRVLFEESPRLLEHADMVQRVTQHSLEAKRINVGFLTMALYGSFPTALKLFCQRWPGIDLRLEQLTSGEQYRRLQNGTLDIGIVGLNSIDQIKFAVRVIDRSPIVLAVPETWPLARRRSIALTELKGIPLIKSSFSDNPASREVFDRQCRAAGFTPTVAHEVNQSYPILKLVASGIAIGMVPAIAHVHNVKGVRFIPVKDKSWDVEMILGMVWNERTLPAAMKHFIDCVIETTADHGKTPRKTRGRSARA